MPGGLYDTMAAKTKEPKFHSLRLLRSKSIPYQLHSYPETLIQAAEVADHLGITGHNMYKTLVASGSDPAKPLIALIPIRDTLNLKQLAAVMQQKRVRMLTQGQAEKITGMKKGGISALALLQRKWPVFLDSSARQWETLILNAGRRGVQIELKTADFIHLVAPILAHLTLPRS